MENKLTSDISQTTSSEANLVLPKKQTPINGNQLNVPVGSPKRKKYYCTLGCLGLVLVVFVLTWLVPQINNFFYQKQFSDSEDFKTLESILVDDLRNKKISEDKYIRELTYSVWDESRLDKQYISELDKQLLAPDVISEANKYANKLSDETKEYLVQKIYIKDIVLGKQSLGLTSLNHNTLLVGPVSAAKVGKSIKRLDKAVKSPSGKFVVWYTTSGGDKVSLRYAKNISENLEKVANDYESNYGIPYKYQPVFSGGISREYLGQALNDVGLSPNLSDTSMQVYLTNSGSDSNLAFYVSSKFPALFHVLKPLLILTGGDKDVISGVPSLPYIAIKPSAIKAEPKALSAVYSHELFHHFQKYICGNGNYDLCSSDGFTQETSAQWASAGVNNTSDFLVSDYLDYYFGATTYPINQIPGHGGYTAYSFLKLVEDNYNKDIVLNSIKNNKSLSYIASQLGGDFPKFWSDFAIKNILNDFSNKVFNTSKLPKPKSVPKSGETSYVNNAAIDYYYLKSNKYRNKVIEISKVTSVGKMSEGVYVTILGRKSGLSDFISFSSDSGKFENIYQDRLTGSESFKVDDYEKFSDLAIIVSNGDIDSGSEYKIEVIGQSIAENKALSPVSTCKKVGTYKNISDYLGQLPAIFSKFNNNVANLNDAGAVDISIDKQSGAGASNILRENAASLDDLSAQIKSTGAEQGDKGIIACSYSVAADPQEQAVHDNTYGRYGGAKFKFADYVPISEDDPDTHYSLFATYSFNEGLKLVNMLTSYAERGQMTDEKTGKQHMGVMVELRFE